MKVKYLFFLLLSLICFCFTSFSFASSSSLPLSFNQGKFEVKAKSSQLEEENILNYNLVNKQDYFLIAFDLGNALYVYKDSISILANSQKIDENKKTIEIPFDIYSKEMKYQDEFHGKTSVFKDKLIFSLKKSQLIFNKKTIHDISLSLQSCKVGMCYPPQTFHIDLNKIPLIDNKNEIVYQSFIDDVKKNYSFANSEYTQYENIKGTFGIPLSKDLSSHQQNEFTQVVLDVDKKDVDPTSESYQKRELGKIILSFFSFLGIGIAMAFTACVFPMLPLLSTMMMKDNPDGKEESKFNVFKRGLFYIHGMSLSYVSLGIIVATLGVPFQIALQSNTVIIVMAIIFILLALSMFNVFTLQIPTSWQTKLATLSHKQDGNSYLSTFIIGVISGLIASPCTTAPLSALLLYVAQTGDIVLGALYLYALSLGIGIPLILIILFGRNILPKSGNWLNYTKTILGFIILIFPIILLSRIVPKSYEIMIWSAYFASIFFYLAYQLKKHKQHVFLSLSVLCLSLYCLTGITGKNIFPINYIVSEEKSLLTFKEVKTLQELKEEISSLKSQDNHQFVMLDFYADWCIYCKQYNEKVFSKFEVKNMLDNKKFYLLKVDLTKNTPEVSEITKEYSIVGMPAILFFDKDGNELKDKRINGFLEKKDFLQHLSEFPYSK